VASNDCTCAHRQYFHLEALRRGLRRVNSVLRSLGRSTGLQRHFGDLEIAVLTGDDRAHRDFPILKSWHDKYDRMKAVFNGAEDERVDGFRFVLVLYCRSTTAASGPPEAAVVEPVSVGSITAHRVYNKPDGRGSGSGSAVHVTPDSTSHWHVELEIQTLLVPVAHQGRGIGTVMQRSMYLLAQELAAEPDPPIYDDDGNCDSSGVAGAREVLRGWSCVKSPWIGKRIVRKVYRQDGIEAGIVRGVVESWLPATTSDFKDSQGVPAPLWRVRYSTRPLEGVLEDLEEHELQESVTPPSVGGNDTPAAAAGGPGGHAALSFSGAEPSFLADLGLDGRNSGDRSSDPGDRSGGGGSGLSEGRSGGCGRAPVAEPGWAEDPKQPRPMCKADMMDAEEATTISMQRITCVTTVYLDDMAKKFYLKNDMKEMLPPYDDGMRRNSSKGAAPRKRIWDNCDHKRLHWWFNTIHGSSFSGDETPEESLKLALENTVDRCKRGEAKVRPTIYDDKTKA
jgi:hypothetical protein